LPEVGTGHRPPEKVHNDIGRFLDAIDPDTGLQGAKGLTVQSILRALFGI
jgi:hypothetical protein